MAALAVAALVRGIGDVINNSGSALSWFSPIAWAQQMRAFVDLRWWPFAMLVALTIALMALAAWLESRRQYDAGVIPSTGEKPNARPITGVFGEQRPGHIHSGVDIAVPEGTPIRAADSGTVALMGWVGGYGNYTCIQHTASMSTCYGHQSRFATSQGASVSQGQVIGYSGNTGNSTGPHLHFEVRINGSPVDPMGYL